MILESKVLGYRLELGDLNEVSTRKLGSECVKTVLQVVMD